MGRQYWFPQHNRRRPIIGPFNPALLNPAMTSVSAELVLGEWEHTSLSPRLREVVILAVGAVWQSEYELYAHSAAARKVGISDDAVRGLASGEIPDDLSKDEKIAAGLTRQLSTTHRVDETLYRQAENCFGTKGITTSPSSSASTTQCHNTQPVRDTRTT